MSDADRVTILTLVWAFAIGMIAGHILWRWLLRRAGKK